MGVLSGSTKSAKILKLKECVASFWGLVAFRGVLEEGVQ